MKILLLGSNGQLGYEAHRTLMCYGDIVAVDYPEIDFSKPKEIIKLIHEIKPDTIYNAVAYTDVDHAEQEINKAMVVNSKTPGEIAIYCRKNNIPLIHFSTDYVFDGTKNQLYIEDDLPNPLNVYGKSKLEGEFAIINSGCPYIIFRTSWVYSLRAGGFVKKVIQWAQNNEELKIVDDQIGNPTWARTLAILTTKFIPKSRDNLIEFIENNKGVFHIAGGGFSSRYEWAQSIIQNLQKDYHIKVKKILPAKTLDFPTLAIRPLFSALDCSKFESTFSLKIPKWEEAMKLMMSN